MPSRPDDRARALLRDEPEAFDAWFRAELSLLLQSEQLGSYELLITPAAYDVGRGSLSLSSCALLAHNCTGLQDGTRLFTTQTSISTNEFTVLGASGPSPIYVVLHAQALAR